MKKISVTDEWLYKYMPIVDEAIIRDLENGIDYDYQFSNKFERRMRKLLKRKMHPCMDTFYRLSKKAAIFLICTLGFLFVITMGVQAYRIKFFETVNSIWEDSILYSYFVNQHQGEIQCNEPGYIPEGYQETERIVMAHWFSVTYTNEDGKIITWDQMMVQDQGELIADIEYAQQIIETVNGKEVTISLYLNGAVNAYCEYGKYVYVLTADCLGIDEVCMMYDTIGIG